MEHGAASKFESKHKAIFNVIKREYVSSESASLNTLVMKLWDLYDSHIEVFQRRLAEIKALGASDEQFHHETDADSKSMVYIVVACVSLVILLMAVAGIAWWMQDGKIPAVTDDEAAGGDV